ncbi:MAG: sugar phosphate nucleotidyltransferase [Acidobacteriota bacterium]
MIGVILAAGRGSRMYPFTEDLPKPILPIGNRPLLGFQLEQMRMLGIEDVYIVVGHLGIRIVHALGDGREYGVRLHYVEQHDTLGLAHALGMLEPYLEQPFLLFLGDIYFRSRAMVRALDRVRDGEAAAVLLSKVEPDPEMIRRNFVILADDGGRVHRVIEKPRHARSQLKGCGLYVFDAHIFDAIRRTPRTALRDEYEITESIQILIEDGEVVRHEAVIDADYNLTRPEDLLVINLLELERLGVDSLIGAGAQLAPGTVVERSVIGPGAVIRHPIEIRETVIFPGVVIDTPRNLRHMVIDSANAVPASPGGVLGA